MNSLRYFLILSFFIFSNSIFAQATGSMLRDDLPLWELGLGVVGGYVPDYPGSAHSTFHTVPIPTFIFRGKRFRADEDGGVRARFYKRDSWEFNLSLGGSLPANSEENAERKGMPDLDTMLEVGPTFIWKILKPTKSNPHKLILSVPIRLAISSNFKRWNTRGFTFNPILVYMKEKVFLENMTFIAGLDTRLASDSMMDYFYSVAPGYATASRPHYEAQPGYLGTSLALGASYILNNHYSFFAGVYQSLFAGSRNLDSPLFVKKSNTAVAAGFVWWLWQSKKEGKN